MAPIVDPSNLEVEAGGKADPCGEDAAGVASDTGPGGLRLIAAVQEQRGDLVEQLLNQRSNPIEATRDGVTPLHMAVFSGVCDIVQLLLDARADVGSRDRYGQTPLFFAPHVAICRQLGVAGADANIINDNGQSPLHLAAHAGLNDVVAWLLEHMKPSSINAQDKNGRTAVYCAAHSNLLPTIMLLQEKGADVTLRPYCYVAKKLAAAHQQNGLDSVTGGAPATRNSTAEPTAAAEPTETSSVPVPAPEPVDRAASAAATQVAIEMLPPLLQGAFDLAFLGDDVGSAASNVEEADLDDDGVAPDGGTGDNAGAPVCAPEEALPSATVPTAAASSPAPFVDVSTLCQEERKTFGEALASLGGKLALERASAEVRRDRVAVLAAVGDDADALYFAAPELREDPAFVAAAELAPVFSPYGEAIDADLLTEVLHDLDAETWTRPALENLLAGQAGPVLVGDFLAWLSTAAASI